MEVTVSRDLPEGLSEAFRMRTHNRSVGVIVRVQTVPVTEQIGALIRLYAVYLHAVLLLSREGHASAGPPGPVTATSSLTAEFEARSRPAWARPCVSRNAGRIPPTVLWSQLSPAVSWHTFHVLQSFRQTDTMHFFWQYISYLFHEILAESSLFLHSIQKSAVALILLRPTDSHLHHRRHSAVTTSHQKVSQHFAK